MNFFKNTDIGLLLIRVALGAFMIIGHGWGKFLRFFGEEPIKFREVFGMPAELSLGLATFAELLCSLLIVVGFMTRWAAIPLAFTMMVAFSVHLEDGFGRQEKALMYLFVFLGILFTGAGKYSLDAIWRKDKF